MQLRKSIVMIVVGLMFFSPSAFADQDGDYTYTVSGGNATITAYTGTGGAISIPATLGGFPTVAIGDYAFNENSTITSVTIPDSVNSIGNSAFKFCASLTSMTIPNSVTIIGNQAFQDCFGLTSVTIPASVMSIGNGAFSDCTALTSIDVDGSNPNYSSDTSGALYNKGMTTLIQYPGGKAGAYVIPGSVTSIETYAFRFCPGLTSVTIPSSVTSIGFGPFLGSTSLNSIIVDVSNPNFSSDADGVLYNKDKSMIIQYPGGKSGGFTIPNSVTIIGVNAFADCVGLTGVTIPDSVTSIDVGAFLSCNSLTSINIPSSVTSIGLGAFLNCSGLTSAYFYGNAPTMGVQVFLNCASGFTVYYIAGNTGFTEPTWQGYPTAVFDPNATTTTTEPTTTTSEPSSTTTSVPSTTTTSVTTTTSLVSSTTTTIEPCTLTIENSLLPLRAGLFARLRRIVIVGTNSEWDKESQVTIDDVKTLIQRVKDEDTIIAWIIIPGKLIANFEPGTKEVRVQTPGKDDCTGEIGIE